MSTSYNLIIGCDGTWNDTEGATRTNVPKLLSACASRNQLIHYEAGVGTAFLEALPGGIYGKGIDSQVLGAYRFARRKLTASPQSAAPWRIFVFGFSRGAYAARRLAGLINHCGIPTSAKDIPLAWQLYCQGDKDSATHLQTVGRFFPVSIAMLGVWDTVKMTLDPDYHDSTLSDCVEAGYHAMALDEKRQPFSILRWQTNSRVTQQWFCGVHADVGGGYFETGLSDISLKWMIDSAWQHGLRFKASAIQQIKPDPLTQLHDSFTPLWQPFGKQNRRVAKNDLLHPSLLQRLEHIASYRPTNLPQSKIA